MKNENKDLVVLVECPLTPALSPEGEREKMGGGHLTQAGAAEGEREPELFAGMPLVPPRRKVLPICTRSSYAVSVKKRWSGFARTNALNNWREFEEHKATFQSWCAHYKRDPQMWVGQKAHNPEGALTSMVWVMQVAIQPDRSCLWPCLDFEEHFQSVFIRRGLLIYLTLLLKEMEA